MLFSPEVACLIHQIFMFCFALSVGYFLTGLLFPLSEIPVVMPPGPALPVGFILVFVYAAAFGLLEFLVPMPRQYTFENVNHVFHSALFLLACGTGYVLGIWKPLIRTTTQERKRHE